MVAAAQFHLHDQVRLLTTCGNAREGSIGHVRGRFARDANPSYFVSFDAEPAGVEVAADALELHTRAS